ncbi:MAG: T9SS type A sorting domain-containing protein [Bacteroidota bacterium]
MKFISKQNLIHIYVALIIWLIHSEAIGQSLIDHSTLQIRVESYSNGSSVLVKRNSNPADSLETEEVSSLELLELFNYNPVIRRADFPSVFQHHQLDPLNELTIFTVFKKTDSETEKLIWSFAVNDIAQIILTDKRIADITQWEFFNHANVDSKLALSTFHKKGIRAYEIIKFNIGSLESASFLPLEPYLGPLAEIIIFDYNLNPLQINQIESALSLKYGLTMREKNYLNSMGEIVWNNITNKEFSNRIAGIAKDLQLGLEQKQSQSLSADLELTIAASRIKKSNALNITQLEELDYLIWGDNNRQAELKKSGDSETYELTRKWMISRSGNIRPNLLRIRLNEVEGIDNCDYTYLVVNESTFGSPPLSSGTFIVGEENLDGFFEYQYPFDRDSSGQDLFSFIAGGPIIPKFWITKPNCQPAQQGVLHFGAEGPNPPFRFELQPINESEPPRVFFAEDNRIFELSIDPGDYSLIIEDSKGYVVEETFFVESADAPAIVLNDEYLLGLSPTTLSVDMSEANCSYEWWVNGKLKSTSSNYVLEETGFHECYVSQDGCGAKHEFTVRKEQYSDFAEMNLFPNPSNDGNFSIVVILSEAEEATLTISDEMGRSVLRKRLSGSDYHYIQEYIDHSGVYFITTDSNEFIKTEKLVITR